MANPTTNYGFVLPTSTDLVTDLPADFEIALQGVDTRIKALNPETTLGDIAYGSATANTNTRLALGTANQVLKVNSGATAPEWAVDPTTDVVTTAGDLIYGTGADAVTRLGIGTAGQVLTVNSGATAPEWAAVPAGGGFDLLSTTALTGASVTINVSNAYKHLQVLITGVYASGNVQCRIRPNGDTTAANYYQKEFNVNGTTLTAEQFNGATIDAFRADIGSSSTATLTGFMWLNVYDYNSADGKYVNGNSFTKETVGNHWTRYVNGVYFGSAVTSFTVSTGSGTFSGGTCKIYGAK